MILLFVESLCFGLSSQRGLSRKYRSFGQILGGLLLNIGGMDLQIIDCHMTVEVSKALRPKRRKRTVGEALTKASTIGLERPVN